MTLEGRKDKREGGKQERMVGSKERGEEWRGREGRGDGREGEKEERSMYACICECYCKTRYTAVVMLGFLNNQNRF